MGQLPMGHANWGGGGGSGTAATHELWGIWMRWDPASKGTPVPRGRSGHQIAFLGGSTAGVRHRHRHGNRREGAGGLGPQRALHGAEELSGEDMRAEVLLGCGPGAAPES